MLAARVEAGEERRARAIPAVASSLRGAGRDRVSRFSIVATNERGGGVRPSASEDRVESLLIRFDVSFVQVGGVRPALCTFQQRDHADQPDRQVEGDADEGGCDSTCGHDPRLRELQRTVGIGTYHESFRVPLTCRLSERSPEGRQHVLGVPAAGEASEDYRFFRRIDLGCHVCGSSHDAGGREELNCQEVGWNRLRAGCSLAFVRRKFDGARNQLIDNKKFKRELDRAEGGYATACSGPRASANGPHRKRIVKDGQFRCAALPLSKCFGARRTNATPSPAPRQWRRMIRRLQQLPRQPLRVRPDRPTHSLRMLR